MKFHFEGKKCHSLLFFFVLLLWESYLENVLGFPESNLHPQTYDFVIVGGGTAGCAVASRLSENGRYTVLVLETGGRPQSFLEIPGLALQNQERPDVTFHYDSVPQKNAGLAINNGVMRATTGKVLGGTSQINFSIFNRGSPLDFDNWANFTKDQGWNYANMLPYFKKSETYLGQFPSTQHGFTGPIPVSFQIFAPGREVWQEAGRELGFKIRDPNGPQEISFTPMEVSRLNGRRHSSFRGYIEPVENLRSNLRIITNAHVDKVVFDSEGKTAVGVSYSFNGEKQTVLASREVILSAGAFGSSTLLMKSGIGPREVLRTARIPQKLELPVGENFQDHPIVPLHIIVNNKSLSFDPEKDRNSETLELWRKFGIGPYSTVLGYSGQTFQASSVSKKEGHGDWADIHIRMGTSSAIFESFQGNFIAPWETSIRLNMGIGRERSRGTVKLRPDGEPLVDFNFLGDKRDEDVLLDAIYTTLNIFEGTKTYQKYGARIFREPLPFCARHRFRSEEYWRCYIRAVSHTGNHPLGTCSMGLVVDSRLRVFGVKGLRIVDASVMPFAPNGNIHAVVYAVAEKGADLILRDNEIVGTSLFNLINNRRHSNNWDFLK